MEHSDSPRALSESDLATQFRPVGHARALQSAPPYPVKQRHVRSGKHAPLPEQAFAHWLKTGTSRKASAQSKRSAGKTNVGRLAGARTLEIE